MTAFMLDVERVIEDEIAAGATQKSVALSYAFGLRNEFVGNMKVDWPRINGAIAKRWPGKLERVKTIAWRIYRGQATP